MVYLLGLGAFKRKTNAEGRLSSNGWFTILKKTTQRKNCALHLTKLRVTMKMACIELFHISTQVSPCLVPVKSSSYSCRTLYKLSIFCNNNHNLALHIAHEFGLEINTELMGTQIQYGGRYGWLLSTTVGKGW